MPLIRTFRNSMSKMLPRWLGRVRIFMKRVQNSVCLARALHHQGRPRWGANERAGSFSRHSPARDLGWRSTGYRWHCNCPLHPSASLHKLGERDRFSLRGLCRYAQSRAHGGGPRASSPEAHLPKDRGARAEINTSSSSVRQMAGRPGAHPLKSSLPRKARHHGGYPTMTATAIFSTSSMPLMSMA